MTNALQIATMVMIGYVTNIVERPPENGPRGNTWYRTNVISAVIQLTPPGLPTVTNTVAVATNVVRLTIVADALPASLTPGQTLTPAEAKAIGLPAVQRK